MAKTLLYYFFNQKIYFSITSHANNLVGCGVGRISNIRTFLVEKISLRPTSAFTGVIIKFKKLIKATFWKKLFTFSLLNFLPQQTNIGQVFLLWTFSWLGHSKPTVLLQGNRKTNTSFLNCLIFFADFEYFILVC